jgi:hypothetical protein
VRRVKVVFLGQCFVFGYRGVSRQQAYPSVVVARVAAERPDVLVEPIPTGYYHPLELPSKVGRILAGPKPDIIVVDAAANAIAGFGPEPVDVQAMPTAVAAVTEGARHGREVAKGLTERYRLLAPFVDAVEQAGRRLVDSSVVPFVRRRHQPTLAEYEHALETTIGLVRAEGPTTALVLQGPSVFNPDESHVAFRPDTIELYRRVNGMVRRVAMAHHVSFVDRLDVAGTANPALFLDGAIRLSPYGHHLFGHALAEHLLHAGLV